MSDPVDRSVRLEKVLADVARRVDDAIQSASGGEKLGFILFTFDFGEGGHMAYISNANREDALASLREYLVHAEGREH